MSDGMGAGDIFRSRILGQGLEDTPYQQQAVSGMMGGMTPEQMQAFFQSPQVQQQFRSFGIDPQAMLGGMRQSPFFPNSFMQQHPQLGGFLNRGLASMAATPAAPEVSGAGSGLSRFAQGAFGGPELLRQYQLHQMMGPFGAMAGMMPTYGEQRRRAIEEAIVKETQQRMGAFPQQMRDLDIQRTEPRVNMGQYGYTTTQYQPGAPEGGQQGVDFQAGMGPGRPMTSPTTGEQFQTPGYGLSPQQQAGWNVQYTPYGAGNVADVHPERQAGAGLKTEQAKTEPSKRDLNKARAEELRSRASLDKARAAWEEFNNRFAAGHGGLRPGDLEKYGKDYTKLEQDTTKQIQALERASQLPKGSAGYVDPATAKQQIDELNRVRTLGKQNFDNARGVAGASSMIAPKGLPQQASPQQAAPQNPYPNQ
jgi:hypothetical protein